MQPRKTSITVPGGKVPKTDFGETPKPPTTDRKTRRQSQSIETSEQQKTLKKRFITKTEIKPKELKKLYQKTNSAIKKEIDQLDKNIDHAKTTLHNLNLPHSIDNKIKQQLDSIIKFQQLLNHNINTNLKYIDRILDSSKNIDKLKNLEPIQHLLNQSLNCIEKILKNLNYLEADDFKTIQETIELFKDQLNSETYINQLKETENISDEEKQKLIDDFKNFSSLFEKLSISLNNTIESLSQEKDYPNTIDIVNLTTDIIQSFEKESQQMKINALITTIGLAILITAITIALTVLTAGWAALILGVLSIPIIGYGTNNFFAINNKILERETAEKMQVYSEDVFLREKSLLDSFTASVTYINFLHKFRSGNKSKKNEPNH